MEEMNADFNDPGSTPPASGVPEFLNPMAVQHFPPQHGPETLIAFFKQ